MMITLLLAGVHHRFEAINQSSVLMLQGIDGKRPILCVFFLLFTSSRIINKDGVLLQNVLNIN